MGIIEVLDPQISKSNKQSKNHNPQKQSSSCANNTSPQSTIIRARKNREIRISTEQDFTYHKLKVSREGQRQIENPRNKARSSHQRISYIQLTDLSKGLRQRGQVWCQKNWSSSSWSEENEKLTTGWRVKHNGSDTLAKLWETLSCLYRGRGRHR